MSTRPSRPNHQSRISERERPSPKAKTNLRRLKVSSGSTSTRSSYSDVMTQTESSLSPTSDDGTMDTQGDDTPKRTRHAGLSDSLDVAASLDPATWPVLKDAIGTSFRFSMDRMSMQSVPEGGEESPQGSLEQALANTMEQNHELHELCWDILRLAGAAEKSVEASVNHHELVQETRRCIQTFQKLKSKAEVTGGTQGGNGRTSASSLQCRIPMHGTAVAHPQAVSLGFRSFGDCEFNTFCCCAVGSHHFFAQPTTGLPLCFGWS